MKGESVIVTLLEVGGVVGQQFLGPVDTTTLSPEQKTRVESAVGAAAFDLDPPEATNVPVRATHVPVRELRVARSRNQQSTSWRVDKAPPWAGAVVAALEAVTEWRLGQPDEPRS